MSHDVTTEPYALISEEPRLSTLRKRFKKNVSFQRRLPLFRSSSLIPFHSLTADSKSYIIYIYIHNDTH